MKNLLMITAGILFLFTSCKNTVKEETNTEITTDVTATETFSPFDVMFIKTKVNDYVKWKTMYDSKDSLRTAFGISKYVLSKDMDDANTVIIIERIADLQKAKDFSISDAVKKAAQEGGSIGAPEFSFIKVVRFNESPSELKDRIMIKHKVKDFDTWLKVYDEEGKNGRSQYGLIDLAIARGLDDSNMVYVAFAVSDMKKASERENSLELKKVMENAGVISKPTAYKYRIEEIF